MTEFLSLEEFPAHFNANRSTPRYNPLLETKPDHPWWQLPKSEVDQKLQLFSRLVHGALEGAPHDDKELQHLVDKANSLAQVERSATQKVALVGAQGAGKSLLTNALFGCDGLSITGADGAACTSVIVRYAHWNPNPDDPNKFHAQVKFLTPRVREDMINEFEKSYYRYYEDSEDLDDEKSPRPASAAQEEYDRRAKDTSEEFFITIFGSRKKFLECWSPRAFKSGEFYSICDLKCEAAINEYEQPSSQGITFHGTDQKHLVSQIKPFLTNVKGEVCLWPLVDQVTIRFQHEMLDQGLELYDVPGMFILPYCTQQANLS
jgi:hypothetical protein